ncbi:MAG: hypothetical protein IJ113_03565 [Eggerthellaceae bacterium]|nr:hypothetical protein [Eggerthellaceae bacterium]
MAEKELTVEELCEGALRRKKDMAKLADNLSGPSRRDRQMSATALAMAAKQDPKRVAEVAEALVDALNRPEAQTRWECLDALTELVAVDTRACEKAIDGADAALFDEDNGPVRLAAMRFLCALGATTANRSDKVWPLIDEAIQCYHGDLEFQDMLVAVIGFSEGALSADVKKELRNRMSFDAANAKGALQKRAEQIVKNTRKKAK